MDNQNQDAQKESYNNPVLDILEGMEDELSEHMSDNELSMLVSQLRRMPTALPTENFVDKAIHRWQKESSSTEDLFLFMDQHKTLKMGLLGKLKVVISHSNFSFLWQSLIFYIVGFLWIKNSTNLPSLFIIPVISAIPFLMGVISMVRCLEHGMCELMMSLKLKLTWYMNINFLIIVFYSLLINTTFTLILQFEGYRWWLLVLHWYIPSILIASIAIGLCTWVRNSQTLLGCYAVIPLLSMFFYGEPYIQNLLIKLDFWMLSTLVVVVNVFFITILIASNQRVKNGGIIIGTSA